MPQSIWFNMKSVDTSVRFLSNMYPSPIVVNFNGQELLFPTAEHYYQAFKCQNFADVERILSNPNPYDARTTGRARTTQLVQSWNDKKLDAMRQAVFLKFLQNKDLQEQLLATGGTFLVHESPWDKFWGMCPNSFQGQNRLGHMLMAIRSLFK